MNTRYNSLIVGAFVLIFGACLLSFILWLTVGLTQKKYSYYVVYFDESVAGLNVDSHVEYNGVTVGHVDALSLSPQSPQLVRVVLALEQGTPITTDTAATLTTQGLTGIAMISLRVVAADQQNHLNVKDKLKVIPTTPSLFFRLDFALNRLIKGVNQVSQDIHQFLSPEITAHVDELLVNGSKAAQAAQVTFENFNQVLPNFLMTINNIQDAISPLKDINREIQENPAILIRGKKDDRKGPGE